MKLTIAYFYPQELNLYGDTGNVEILAARTKTRQMDVEIRKVSVQDKISKEFMKEINLLFMGGGPDSGQERMYLDLIEQKGPYIKEYIEEGGTALFICGSYQLMGEYYRSADGKKLEGLGIYNMYTQHFGLEKKRCVGNIVSKVNNSILQDPLFINVNNVGDTIVGFENHGGRTYPADDVEPFATVIKGHGNNSEDGTEGVYYKNTVGSYFHGPLLSKNPHIADYLIAKALNLEKLSNLDDTIIKTAHSALVKRFGQ